MACDVLWTKHARKDVEHAVRYIAERLASPKAASDLLDAVDKAIEEISAFPEACHISSRPELFSRGLRVKRVKRYVMLYSYDGDVVVVSRVFHSLQDYARLVRCAEHSANDQH